MKIIATFGQDTPAYADLEIEVPDGATDEQIREIVLSKAGEIGDLVFEPSYDWAGLRIVSITDDSGRCIDGNIPIEPSAEDLGQEVMRWLRGQGPLSVVLSEARRQGVSVHPDVERALASLQDVSGQRSTTGQNASVADAANLMPWVIYHAQEAPEARFWNDEDGWSNLAGATRYAVMPLAPYPFGGPENTQAGALCIGTMRPFTVMLAADPMSTAYAFDCFAEDENHAVEQAKNAYPDQQVQQVLLTEEIDN